MSEPATDAIEQQLRSAFPAGTISRVQVFAYGDDPRVEPGQAGVRVSVDRGGRPEGKQADREILQGFAQANDATLKNLREHPPIHGWIEFRPDGSAAAGGPRLTVASPGRADEGPEDLTPVMTRLGPADLATVDTLIAAGIAASRAEAVRWALSRIREHSAYADLQQRVRDIEELKSQF
jgi:hypothetical protein